MLPKTKRLRAAEVRAILKSGHAGRAEGVSVKYVKGSSGRAAVVVSSKVARSAVARNRLRRLAYTALRTSLPANTHLVLFILSPKVTQAAISALCSRLS